MEKVLIGIVVIRTMEVIESKLLTRDEAQRFVRKYNRLNERKGRMAIYLS